MSDTTRALIEPKALVTLVPKSGKNPSQEFGGWPSDEPSGRNADWSHNGTATVGPDGDKTADELVEWLDEHGYHAALLDVDGANLVVLDYDVVDDPEDADRDGGRWLDKDALDEHVAEEWPDALVYETQSGGLHVYAEVSDDVHRMVWDNELKAGFGVESLKGPSAKGYVLSPFSEGYEVWQDGSPAELSADDVDVREQFSEKESRRRDAENAIDPSEVSGGEDQSAVFDLDLVDVIDMEAGGRGDNPLGHHGDSHDYFVVDESGESAHDHKHNAGYNALTMLLCDAGRRDPDEPEGALSPDDLLIAWVRAKETGAIPDDDPVPREALIAAAEAWTECSEDDVTDDWKLPAAYYNEALDAILVETGVEPGRNKVPVREGSPTLTQLRRTHRLTEADKGRVQRIQRTLESRLLEPIECDMELEIPMRAGKSGHAGEGACPEDNRIGVTPNTGDARDSYRKHGPDAQTETIPSTNSWLGNHDEHGEEFEALVAAGFRAARVKSYMLQKHDDLDVPDSEPYFEQYDEEPTEDLVLTSPGVEALSHWNEWADTIVWDDVHPLRHYTDTFRLDDTEWEDGVRGTVDKLVRALPVGPNTLDALLEDEQSCRRVVRDVSMVTKPNPDRGQFNLMALSRVSDDVTYKTWERLLVVIDVETGVDATEPDVRVATKRADGAYVWTQVPFFPDDVNMVIMSGDNPPELTEKWFDLLGREDHERVAFSVETLRAYWRAHEHEVVVADTGENTRTGGNVWADRSEQLEDFAREAFAADHGEPVVFDALKSFKRSGMEKDDVRDDADAMNFGNTRGNDAADDRSLGVVQGSSHWPGFVETMTAVLGEPAELEQNANEPVEAVDPDTGDEHEAGEALLAWMKQAEPTQAAARVGTDVDGRSVVVCGTRHIGPQFDAYDVSEHVHFLSDAERETLQAVREGYDTIEAVAEVRGVTRQAAGHVLNNLAAEELLEKEEYAGENGAHGYEGGEKRYIFTVPSERWTSHLAPLAEHRENASENVGDGETGSQRALSDYGLPG